MAKRAIKKDEDQGEISVQEIVMGEAFFCVLGTSPLICNRLTEKTRHELLMPAPKKNAAERAIVLKHDPIDEFRSSIQRNHSDDGPTRIVHLGSAFKKALAQVAVDVPGATKAAIGRLTNVPQITVDIYGVPRVFSTIVRQGGINKTPDVRTRAMLPRWATYLTVRYVASLIKEHQVANLLGAAGIIIGVGDYRNEKGAGSYGQFRVCATDDPEFLAVIKEGREAQDAALAHPVAYDADTEELLAWFNTETARREKSVPSAGNGKPERPGKRSRKAAAEARAEAAEQETIQ
jgi:hypothetical protein